jgi:alpha-beta hydrolase superfamily lysophospholipase
VARLQDVRMTEVTFTVYDGARHELTNETNRDEFTADLLAWLADAPES